MGERDLRGMAMTDGWADGLRPAEVPPVPDDATLAERVILREVANLRQEVRELRALVEQLAG